jgi:hypothetical protein
MWSKKVSLWPRRPSDFGAGARHADVIAPARVGKSYSYASEKAKLPLSAGSFDFVNPINASVLISGCTAAQPHP